jgi:hypothetical protein
MTIAKQIKNRNKQKTGKLVQKRLKRYEKISNNQPRRAKYNTSFFR